MNSSIQAERGRSGQHGFPLRLFAAAFAVSLLAAAVGASLSWRLEGRLDDLKIRQFQLSEYISRVMLFDEVLTMSARMAAATGDVTYKKRYDKFDAQLRALLKETEGAIRRPEVRQFIEQTDEANGKLVEMERRALSLTFEGRQAEASDLLVSDEYFKWKQANADGVEKEVTWERNAIESEQQNARSLTIVFQISSGVVIVALLWAWYFALRAGRRWSQERLISEAALRKAHDELERRIRERTADLQRRDALLHAAATSAAEVVTTANLDEAIQISLELISNAIRVDRILVLEQPANHAGAPVLRYVWESANVPFKVDQSYFANPALMTSEIVAWAAPLRKGRIVTTDVRTADGDVKRMFEQLGVKKNLVIPVIVDGKYWGQIGFDNCDQERIWADFEIEILQTLAELIGTAIQRDRYVKELADANRIVQNTPTILYRVRGEPSLPMIYISQNIR